MHNPIRGMTTLVALVVSTICARRLRRQAAVRRVRHWTEREALARPTSTQTREEQARWALDSEDSDAALMVILADSFSDEQDSMLDPDLFSRLRALAFKSPARDTLP